MIFIPESKREMPQELPLAYLYEHPAFVALIDTDIACLCHRQDVLYKIIMTRERITGLLNSFIVLRPIPC